MQQNNYGEYFERESILRESLGYELTKRALTPNIAIPPEYKVEDEIEKVGRIEPMNPIEILEQDKRDCCYYIKYPIVCTRHYLSYICVKIIRHPVFDPFIIFVILANCVILATDDPTTIIQETWQEYADYIFQGIYSAELVFKVVAMGFIFNKGAYMRDFWNIFDFVIVIFGYLQYLNINNGDFDLRPLRIFRVLRPLRTITSIEGLRVLMAALASSLSMLRDAVIILIFFLTIFAIAGLQLWHGTLKKRCMETATGKFLEDVLCGSKSCPDDYTCEYYGENPNFDVTNFDNFFSALFVVFTAVTQEGWTEVQGYLIYSFGYLATIYFNVLIYVGSYFLFNFTLAVINSKVSDLYDKNRKALNEKREAATVQASMKSKILGKRTAFHNSALKSVGRTATTVKFELQPVLMLKYKEMMGIHEFEDSDFVIESRHADEKKKVKKQVDNMPKWVVKNFQESLKPKPMNKKPEVNVHGLKDFTDEFFLNTLNIENEPNENTNRESDHSLLNDSESLLDSLSNLDKKNNGKLIHEGFKTLNDNDKLPNTNIDYNAKQNAILEEENQDFSRDSLSDLEESPTSQKPNYQTDKFVINDDINIDLTSENDVLSHEAIRVKTINVIDNSLPPYKIRSKYLPVGFDAPKSKKQNKDKEGTTEKSQGQSNKDSRSKAPETSNKRSLDSMSNVPSLTSDKTKSKKEQHDNSDTHSVGGKSATETQNEKGKAGGNQNTKLNSVPIPELLEKAKAELVPEKKPKVIWSGQDVIPNHHEYLCIRTTRFLNETRVWKKGLKGVLQKLQYAVKVFLGTQVVDIFLILCGLANTVILAMNRYQQPKSESDMVNIFNNIFTGVFIAEMTLKIFSIGIVKYVFDTMNIIDGVVVILSVVELIFLDTSNGNSLLKSFQAFRILRAFRVIRMIRVLRALRSMRLLIQVISEAITSFAYVGILIVLFLFIYTLLGMQLFGGKFPDSDDPVERQNYDSFHKAFLCVYQILTIENWQTLQYFSMKEQNAILVALFYVSWLFIGNYILLNLFLALMLDAFAEVEDANLRSGEAETTDKTTTAAGTRSVTGSETTKRLTTFSTSVVSKQTKSKFEVKKADSKLMEEDEEMDIKEKKKVPLHDTSCYYSLYLFSKENKLRIISWRIVSSKLFDGVIVVFIVLSSVLLAINTYYLRGTHPTEEKVLKVINICFVSFFTAEAVFKIMVYGFVFDKGTYLRDLWNILDFIIVISSIIDASVSAVNLPMIRILRLLRTFRPLRFMSHNRNMRILVKSLFKSLSALCNTLILILIIFLMFSIVGVNFFAGKLQYCNINPFNNETRDVCISNGGEWYTYDLNFDNVINGLIFLFELATQENWPIIVYEVIDCTDVDKGPRKEYSWYYSYYFVVFLFIGSMFLLNLFVGVLFYNFTKVQKQETATFGDVIADENQLNWISIQKLIIRAEPNYNARTTPDQHSWRLYVHKFVTHFYFEVAIAIVIILNMVQMAMRYDGQSSGYELALQTCNYVFTGIFTIEIILKLIGFGCDFWYEPWNIFDLIVVICSFVDIILSNMLKTSLKALTIGPQLLRVLRVLRVARLFRLIRKYDRLQAIMEIIQLSLPSILNVFALLALIIFIYAIMGCFLFYDVDKGNVIDDINNFKNFGFAFLLCLKIATGEDWNDFMFDCARTSRNCVAGLGCGNANSYIYFISFKIIVTFIMLQLFVLIVLQLFEKYFITDDNILSSFKKDYEEFQEKWLAVRPSHKGYFIHVNKLLRFFRSLPSNLGYDSEDPNRLTSQIIALGIRSDAEKNVFFNELLYRVVLRQSAEIVKRNNFIKKRERKTLKKILRAAEKKAKNAYYDLNRKNFIITQANPFLSLMRLRISMKLWRRYKDIHFAKVKEYEEQGIMNYRSEEDDLPEKYIVLTKLKDSAKNSNSVNGKNTFSEI